MRSLQLPLHGLIALVAAGQPSCMTHAGANKAARGLRSDGVWGLSFLGVAMGPSEAEIVCWVVGLSQKETSSPRIHRGVSIKPSASRSKGQQTSSSHSNSCCVFHGRMSRKVPADMSALPMRRPLTGTLSNAPYRKPSWRRF
jgi:hypothetical protein